MLVIRPKFIKYVMLIVVIMMTMSFFIWRNKRSLRELHVFNSIEKRDGMIDKKSNPVRVLHENRAVENGYKTSDFDWLTMQAGFGDRSGIYNSQHRGLSTQCLSKEEMIANLKELISDLIELRVSLDGKSVYIIDEKYNKFQKMLQKIEVKVSKSPRKSEEGDEVKTKPFACPEKRIVTRNRKWFERTNCSKFALSDTVSVIIDSPHLSTVNQNKLYKEIKSHHEGINVFIVLDRGSETRPSQINKLIREIATPFVYIARHVDIWNKFIDLERLVDVITSAQDVVAVGNAIVNISNGYWSHGCTQMRLKNYVLKYERGYHNSLHSCMQCDALEGPFLVKTDFLRSYKFRDFLRDGYYEDWFLRVQGHSWKNAAGERERSEKIRRKNTRRLIYSCPDVASQLTMPDCDGSKMEQMADLWDIKKIVGANGESHWFGCKRGLSRPTQKCRVGRGMSVPPCCLDNLIIAIIFVMRKCGEYNIVCELMEGTLLGAVKFQSVLPWERDADIAFYAGDFDKLLALALDVERKGYSFKVRGRN